MSTRIVQNCKDNAIGGCFEKKNEFILASCFFT